MRRRAQDADRGRLTLAATMPSAAAMLRLTGSVWEGIHQKTTAARAAPAVIPTWRAAASMPPAAPERARGAQDRKTRLFGV